ncbi:MAG: hypothetical protein AAF193_00125 [Bacteroidota bacterium]
MEHNSISHSLGASGSEAFQSTGKVLQKLFSPEEKSSIEGIEDQTTSVDFASKSFRQNWNKIPKHIKRKIENTMKEQNQTSNTTKTESTKDQSTFHFRKGYKIGVELEQSSGLGQDQLVQVTEHILNASPSDSFLQGIAKGIHYKEHSKQKEQLDKMNALSQSKSKEKGNER